MTLDKETFEYESLFGTRVGRMEHGFYRTENHTIMSGYVIRWSEYPPDSLKCGLEISASRDGVLVQGCSKHYQDVSTLENILELAQKEHEMLERCNGRPKG